LAKQATSKQLEAINFNASLFDYGQVVEEELPDFFCFDLHELQYIWEY
jgi:hypothetical protein